MTIARNQTGVTRDVQDELVRLHAEKRRQAGGPSPVKFHNELLVGDDWTCLFIKCLSQGMVIYKSDVPPASALDVGCGTGLWCIEAAKQWPDTTIVGLDIHNIQPDLTQIGLGIDYRDLAQRVKWVHGSFLDPLPFESNHFDLVRICCIGLWVPEDSWQDLLEECSRVLTPGGRIEIIEEDIIFPAGRTRKPNADASSHLRVSNVRRQLSGTRLRSDSFASRLTTLTMHSTQHGPTPALTEASSISSSSLLLTTEHTSNSTSLDTLASSFSSRHRSLSGSRSALFPDEEYQQDHARLKSAWEEMLDERFISHKLLNVLQFYLSSAFSKVHVHPSLHVLLPPSSRVRNTHAEDKNGHEHSPELEHAHGWQAEDLAEWMEGVRKHMVRLRDEPEHRRPTNGNTPRARPKAGTVSNYNTFHLKRQVAVVRACKDALWRSYRILNGGDGEWDGSGTDPNKLELREDFERDWELWEEDMKSRLGVRDQLRSKLGWNYTAIPDASDKLGVENGTSRRQSFISESEQTQADKNGGDEPPPLDGEPDPTSICRALRGFVAWKV